MLFIAGLNRCCWSGCRTEEAPMSIRKILLPLTGTAAGEAALECALIVARLWNAHVSALHVRIDARDVAPLAGEGLSGAMIEEMMTATEKESAERARAVRALFDRFLAEHDVMLGEPRWGEGTPTASFASVIGREEDLVAQLGRLADVTVVPHPDSGNDVSSSDALHAVLFDSGRPVMIAPRVGPESIGTRICVAWNGTAEASAAVYAALPWLRRAKAVRVLFADDYQRRGPAAVDLVAYLALHDITAEAVPFKATGERDAGAGLLAACTDFGADLLAMGAYSHSRLRQLILGGVTRHVLEHAELSVLMNR
jgi:nucleotide-binding universal stress UspA family protein